MEPTIENLLTVKDRIIEQQEEQILLLKNSKDMMEATLIRGTQLLQRQNEVIDMQRNRIADLDYNNHRFESAHKEPLRFLTWVILRDVWPFKFLWNKV